MRKSPTDRQTEAAVGQAGRELLHDVTERARSRDEETKEEKTTETKGLEKTRKVEREAKMLSRGVADGGKERPLDQQRRDSGREERSHELKEESYVRCGTTELSFSEPVLKKEPTSRDRQTKRRPQKTEHVLGGRRVGTGS